MLGWKGKLKGIVKVKCKGEKAAASEVEKERLKN